MRKALAAIRAVPVFLQVYLRALARGPVNWRRAALALAGLGAVAAFAVLSLRPATAYHPPPVDPQALARLVTPVETGVGPQQRVEIDFNAPMDRASVSQALVVEPRSAVHLRWDATSRRLEIGPAGSWQPGTFYTFTVGAAARSDAGRPLAHPATAVMLTDPAPTATIAPTSTSGTRALADTAFQLRFSTPVEAASVESAFSISPSLPGFFSSADPSGPTQSVTFTPTESLQPNAVYVATLDGPVVTPNGTQLDAPPRLVVRAVTAPTVVRFRPTAGAQRIDPGTAVSVRFSRPMDRASTQAAFRLSGVAANAGKFSWADGDTVLVFEPTRPLTHGRAYVMSVGSGARSVDGLPLSMPSGATEIRSAFRVAPAAPRPATVATAVAAPKKSTSSSPATAPAPSSSVSGAPWYSYETWALSLLNCTRTGGWVLSNGTCSQNGSGHYSAYVAPLRLNAGISNSVTRPYARLLATEHACDHFLDGTPGDRLKQAGYTGWQWGENIGCESNTVRGMVLNAILFFQSEKPYNGGHWANLKNAKFTSVGVGIWEYHGYGIVVFDFYGG